MTQHCCVQECRHNNKTSSCAFKKFPNDPQKGKLWETAVRRSAGSRSAAPEWRRSPYDRICECHFDSDQFEIDPQDGHRRLRRSAVPRLFGGKAKIPSHRSVVVEQKGVITKSNLDSLRRDQKKNISMSSEEVLPLKLEDISVEGEEENIKEHTAIGAMGVNENKPSTEDNIETSEPNKSDADDCNETEEHDGDHEQVEVIRHGVSVIASTADAEAFLYSGASQDVESGLDVDTSVSLTSDVASVVEENKSDLEVPLYTEDSSALENLGHEVNEDSVVNEGSTASEVVTDGDMYVDDQVAPEDEMSTGEAALDGSQGIAEVDGTTVSEGDIEVAGIPPSQGGTEVEVISLNESDAEVAGIPPSEGGTEVEVISLNESYAEFETITSNEGGGVGEDEGAVEGEVNLKETYESSTPELVVDVKQADKSCEILEEEKHEEITEGTSLACGDDAKESIPAEDIPEDLHNFDQAEVIEEVEVNLQPDDKESVEEGAGSGHNMDVTGEGVDHEEERYIEGEEGEEVSEIKENDADYAGEGELLDEVEGEDFGGEEEEYEEGEEMGDEVEVEIEDCSDSEMEPEGGVTYIISEGMIVVEENEGSETFQSADIADVTEEEHIVCEDQLGKTTRIVIKVPSSKNVGETEIPVTSESSPELEEAPVDDQKNSEVSCAEDEVSPSMDSGTLNDQEVCHLADDTESSKEATDVERAAPVTQSPLEDKSENTMSEDTPLPNSAVSLENAQADEAKDTSETVQDVELEEAVEISSVDAVSAKSNDATQPAPGSYDDGQNDESEVSLSQEKADDIVSVSPKTDTSGSNAEAVDTDGKDVEASEVNSESLEDIVQPSVLEDPKTGDQTAKPCRVLDEVAILEKGSKPSLTLVASANTKTSEKLSPKLSSKHETKGSKAVSRSKSNSVPEKRHSDSSKEKQTIGGNDVLRHSSKHTHSSSHKHKSQSSKTTADEKSPNTVKSSNKNESSPREERAPKNDTAKKQTEVKETVSRNSNNESHHNSKGGAGHRTRSNSTSSKESPGKEKRPSRKEDSSSKKPSTASANIDALLSTNKTIADPKTPLRSSRSRKSQSDFTLNAKATEDSVPKKKEKVKTSNDTPVKPRHSERVSRATEKALASGLVSRRSKPSPIESSEKPQDVISDDQTSSPRKSKRKAESSPTVAKEDTPASKRRTTRSGEAQSPKDSPVASTQSLRSVRKNKMLKRKRSSNDEPPAKQAHFDDTTSKDKVTDEFLANIPKMCRICGSKNDNLLNVFGPEGRTMQLAEKVHSILPIKMREDEPLPSGVCHSCVVTLMACEKLVEKSSSLDKRLRTHFDCPEEKALKDKTARPSEEAPNMPPLKSDKPAKVEPQPSQASSKSEEVSVSVADETPASTSKSAPTTRSSARVSAKHKQTESAAKANTSVKPTPAKEVAATATTSKAKVTPSPDSEDSPPVLEAEPPQSHLPSSNQEPSAQPPVLIPQPGKPVPELVPLPAEDASNASKQRFGNTYRARMKPGQWEKIERGLEAIHGELTQDEQEAGPADMKPFSGVQTEEFHIVDLDMNVEEVSGEAPADKSTPTNISSEFHVEIPEETTEEETTVQQSSPKSVIDSILVDWSGDEDEVVPVQKVNVANSTRKAAAVESARDSVNGSTRPNQSGASSKTPCLFGDDEEGDGAPRTRSKALATPAPASGVAKPESFWPEPAPGTSTTTTSEKPPSDVPWKCFVCGKRGKSLSKFLEHKKLHLNDRKLVSCPKCSESFSNMSLLRAHMKAHHGDDDEDDVVEQQPRQTRRRVTEKVVDVDLAPATDGLYHCSLCLSAFTSIESLCQHKLTHSKTETSDVFKCTVCRRSFYHHKEFQQHMTTHQPSSQNLAMFQCAKCDMKMINQKEFIEHIESHNSEHQNFTCDLCNKVFDTKHKLRSHRSTVHKSTAYACHLCDKVCQKRITLIEHLRKHTGDNPFACPVCNKRFNRLANYKAHMTIHENARRYECPYCGKRFNRQSIQQRHIKTHTSEQSRKHRCRVCNLTFGLATEMFTHRKLHTREEVERATWEDEKQRLALTSFPCKVCQMPFFSVEEVLAHMPMHTDDERDIAAKLKNPRLECDICGKVLNSKRTFNAHRSSHIDGKPFVCKICSKGYSTSTGLNYHMLSHTGERPFPCTFCQKGYKNSTDLKVHMRQHTGEFPYKCNLCNKAFRSASSLQKHGFVHSDHRPFKCQFCNMSFKRENTKLNHERIHTNDRRFKCKVCSRTFIQKGACDSHEKLHFRGGALSFIPGESTGSQMFDENSANVDISASSSKIDKHDLFEDFEEEDFDEDDDDDEDEYIIYEDEDGIDDGDADEEITSDLQNDQRDSLDDASKASVKSLTKGAFEEASKSSNGVDLPATTITPVPVTISSDAVPSVGDHSVHITIL